MTSATDRGVFAATAVSEQMVLLSDAAVTQNQPAAIVERPVVPGPAGEQTMLPRRLTERWNAELFVHLHGGRFRHVTGIGWYVWDGSRWSRAEGEKKALHTAGTLGDYIDRLDLPTRGFESRLVNQHIKSTESTAGMKAMLAQAATFEAISLEAHELDGDPELLCTPGGIVNLRTGTIGPADPRGDRHSQLTRVTPHKMPTPRWKNFLFDTFGADDNGVAVIDFLQVMMGYSITGDVGAHTLAFLYGEGKNGKSVLLDTVVAIMGDYAAVAPEGFLMDKPFAEHATELTELHGRRIMLCNEVRADDRFNEQRVKALTSGGDMSARRMRKDFYTFKMTHHLWLIGNHKPEVTAGGYAFWRRLRLIPFLRTVSEERRVHNLAERMVAEEGPGILQWLVEGAQRYLSNPDSLEGPAVVRMATQEYAQTEDHIGRFLNEMCVRDLSPETKVRVLQPQLYLAYMDWWRDEGVGGKPSTQRNFHSRVRQELGIKSPEDLPRSNGKKYYPGLGLKRDGEDAAA